MFCMNIRANFHADGSPLQGIKCACFEKRSITVHMTVLPLLSRRSTKKSIAISSHGLLGLATDCNSPRGFPGRGFILAQTWQFLVYSSISLHMSGHQNCCLVRCNVLTKPKWPAGLMPWHWCNWTSFGIYNLSPFHIRSSLCVTRDLFSANQVSVNSALFTSWYQVFTVWYDLPAPLTVW